MKKMAKMIISPQGSSSNQKVDLSEKVPPKNADVCTPAHRNALRRCELRGKFTSLSDQIAEHEHFSRNFKWPGADLAFPDVKDVLMRFVTKCYPYAKGGILFVDEPRTEPEMIRAYERQKILKKKGLRHVVIESDSSLEHCLQQLGEL